ncbi:MAG: 50S ribosome-binding GTPase [Phycisphaerales bacterium]|nr:50S ribosome-binding GTPase [Phycisphaerales bacterium]MDP6890763.1 50S ribosome-binding GTPase [Phycisphaerales bacterium]
MKTPTARLLTAESPGAVAIIELSGHLEALCKTLDLSLPQVGQIKLANLSGVDEVLLARVDTTRLHCMPHGGPQVIKLLEQRLTHAGITMMRGRGGDWPEAVDVVEAAMLEVLPQAKTLLTLELLLAQPSRWNANVEWTDEDEKRSMRLRRLLKAPRVVLVGKPNIGKSTLLNALAGRHRAVVSDMPGTTRDAVGAMLNLGGLLVQWFDAAGLRSADDPVESAAIAASQEIIEKADLLIATADIGTGWPSLPRQPDLRVGLRSDLGFAHGADVSCAAGLKEGLEDVVSVVREALVPEADLESERPWRFTTQLPPTPLHRENS